LGRTPQGVVPAAEVLKKHVGLRYEWKTGIFTEEVPHPAEKPFAIMLAAQKHSQSGPSSFG